MPNISFDIFFDQDFLNFTATRSGGSAPKVKPAWKVRTAPKLPPKEQPEANQGGRPTLRKIAPPPRKSSNPKVETLPSTPKGESSAPPKAKAVTEKLNKIKEQAPASDAASESSGPAKKAAPKLSK